MMNYIRSQHELAMSALGGGIDRVPVLPSGGCWPPCPCDVSSVMFLPNVRALLRCLTLLHDGPAPNDRQRVGARGQAG